MCVVAKFEVQTSKNWLLGKTQVIFTNITHNCMPPFKLVLLRYWSDYKRPIFMNALLPHSTLEKYFCINSLYSIIPIGLK